MMQMLRRAVLPLLKWTAIDVGVTHPWIPKQRVFLNSFRHKGYWYHGKAREKSSMELFAKLISSGFHVVEVGGHIGFISQYFSYLVGAKGMVFVFESGSNNLPYIKRNTAKFENIKLIEKGAGAENCTATFFEESLTGQNNSFVRDFQGLRENAEAAHVTTKVTSREVEIVTLDHYFNDTSPDFIKIDVEGFEYSVLRGGKALIEKFHPALMVEVQADRDNIWNFFLEANYILFTAELQIFHSATSLISNVFALHRVRHRGLIEHLGLNAR